MGDFTDVIRVASQRPLNDAAFFIAFNIRNRRSSESVFDALKSSHMEASLSELNQAIAASSKLEADCLAVPLDRLDDPDEANSVVQKTKDDNPGFIAETYSLIERYIRTSGEETAPDEELDQEETLITSREWSDIPYFKKPWFQVVVFLIFMPGYLVLIWSGDSYYRKNGIVYRMSLKKKQLMTGIVLVLIVSYFLR